MKAILERIPKRLQAPVHVLLTLSQDMVRFDLFKHASAMAYVTLLSVVPSLAAVFALVSLFGSVGGANNTVLAKLKSFMLDHLASGSGEQVVQQIENFLSNLDTTKIGISGLIGLMVSLILLLRQIELALNRIWLVARERNVITRFVYFWTFITLGTFLLVLVFGSVAGGQLQSLMQLGEFVPVKTSVLSKMVPWIASLVFFVLLYKVVPNCYVSWKQALTGAIPALILFRLASSFYGTFTAKFTNYQAVYGALAALPLFLMWLYILWLIILLGALMSWRSQQGFFLAEETADETAAKDPGDKYRNFILQIEIPMMIMQVVYKIYKQGNAEYKRGIDLASELKLPVVWVRESIDLLVEKKYLALTVDHSKPEMGTFGDVILFPLVPAIPFEKFESDQFVHALRSEASLWFAQWQPDLYPELRSKLTFAQNNRKD